MTLVSVVIPVYNAEEYLRECLDSLLAQTLSDFEVICVDDGSTDGSMEILSEYGACDERFQTISRTNSGAGAARNAGIEIARGEYLLFLDADDFAEPRLLEAAYRQCKADTADIAVFHSQFYDVRTGRSYPAERLLRRDLLPADRPFSRAHIPNYILTFSSPAPWNKLYRRDFVTRSGLRFQEIRRTNDLYFTKCAFVLAERITVVDEILVNYRIGGESNLQSGNHEAPMEFFESLIALRDELERIGALEELRISLASLAVAVCVSNLGSLRDPDAYLQLFEAVQTRILPEMGLLDPRVVAALDAASQKRAESLLTKGPDGYLKEQHERAVKRYAAKKRELRRAKRQLREARAEFQALRASLPYKIARAAQLVTGTAAARKLRRVRGVS